jgi:hypothetical protein
LSKSHENHKKNHLLVGLAVEEDGLAGGVEERDGADAGAGEVEGGEAQHGVLDAPRVLPGAAEAVDVEVAARGEVVGVGGHELVDAAGDVAGAVREGAPEVDGVDEDGGVGERAGDDVVEGVGDEEAAVRAAGGADVAVGVEVDGSEVAVLQEELEQADAEDGARLVVGEVAGGGAGEDAPGAVDVHELVAELGGDVGEVEVLDGEAGEVLAGFEEAADDLAVAEEEGGALDDDEGHLAGEIPKVGGDGAEIPKAQGAEEGDGLAVGAPTALQVVGVGGAEAGEELLDEDGGGAEEIDPQQAIRGLDEVGAEVRCEVVDHAGAAEVVPVGGRDEVEAEGGGDDVDRSAEELARDVVGDQGGPDDGGGQRPEAGLQVDPEVLEHRLVLLLRDCVDGDLGDGVGVVADEVEHEVLVGEVEQRDGGLVAGHRERELAAEGGCLDLVRPLAEVRALRPLLVQQQRDLGDLVLAPAPVREFGAGEQVGDPLLGGSKAGDLGDHEARAGHYPLGLFPNSLKGFFFCVHA